jgi:Terminase small subunit
MARRASGKGARHRPKQLGPQTDRDKLFCERWLIHYDKDRAYREAGFSAQKNAGHLASAKLEKFADYLRPIRDAKAKIVAERLAIDSDAVLQGMVKKVFFDPTTFFERSTEPLTHLVHVEGKTEKVEQVRTWNGQPVYGERMKPYSDLTPEQRSQVEITSEAGDRLRYRLPNIREQHAYFTSLGRQFGLFSEKLVIERHHHKHQHHHLDFANVPTEKLNALTRQMLPMVGLEFAQMLGYTPEEVEEAAREEGVIMEVAHKSPA